METVEAAARVLTRGAETCLSRDTHLVVHVCNIHDEFDLVLKIIPQNAPYNIRANIISCMTQMRIVVYSRPTGIPSHSPISPVEGDERRFGAGERVPDLQ